MRNTKFLLLLTVIISVAGCNKDDDANDVRIKTITVQFNNTSPVTSTYTYNDDGRLKSKISGPYTGSYFFYNDSSIVEIEVGGDTVVEYRLNKKGYVYNRIDEYDEMFFEYNENGNLVNFDGTLLTWLNGNNTKVIYQDTVEMDYYLDQKSTIGNVNKGQEYFGVASVNPLKSTTTNGMSTITITYEYDKKGRITKSIDSNNDKYYYTYY